MLTLRFCLFGGPGGPNQAPVALTNMEHRSYLADAWPAPVYYGSGFDVSAKEFNS